MDGYRMPRLAKDISYVGKLGRRAGLVAGAIAVTLSSYLSGCGDGNSGAEPTVTPKLAVTRTYTPAEEPTATSLLPTNTPQPPTATPYASNIAAIEFTYGLPSLRKTISLNANGYLFEEENRISDVITRSCPGSYQGNTWQDILNSLGNPSDLPERYGESDRDNFYILSISKADGTYREIWIVPDDPNSQTALPPPPALPAGISEAFSIMYGLLDSQDRNCA